MRTWQPPVQLTLPFLDVPLGDAPTAGGERVEVPMATHRPETPVATMSLMEDVCQRANLQRAYRCVVANQGSPGVDGMRVDQLGPYLHEQWPTIRDQLRTGTYHPKPVKRVNIPKPGGGERALGIPMLSS